MGKELKLIPIAISGTGWSLLRFQENRQGKVEFFSRLKKQVICLKRNQGIIGFLLFFFFQ
jgi:hypothetical protein